TFARAYADELNSPNAVAVAGDKVLLVGGGRVDVRDRVSGKRLSLSEPFRGATDVVGLPGGDWIISQSGGELIRVSGATRTTLAKELPVGYLPNAPSGGVAVGGKGDVYVSSDVENAIYKISAK